MVRAGASLPLRGSPVPGIDRAGVSRCFRIRFHNRHVRGDNSSFATPHVQAAPPKPIVIYTSAVATLGLAILSLRGLSFGLGETYTLAGSVCYSLHIVLLGRFSKRTDSQTLASTQLIMMGALSLLLAAPGGIQVPKTAFTWFALFYMALLGGSLAMLLQTWAQSRISQTRVAIIMTCEPVFAAVTAIIFGGEPLTLRLVIGGGLIVAAILASELTSARKAKTRARVESKS